MTAPPFLARMTGSTARAWRSNAPIVPLTNRRGPTPWIIAVMALLTVVVVSAALATRNTAAAATSQVAGGITVQIIAGSPVEREAAASAAAAVLRATEGIDFVRQVPAEEIAELVQPWLGSNGGLVAPDDALPLPALIDARFAAGASDAAIAALRQRLAGAVPTARVTPQAEWLLPVLNALAAVTWVALGLVLLIAGATIAAILLATRTALDSSRETIAIVHLLGATDTQIARVFQRSVAGDAAAGSAIGFAVALPVLWLLAGRFAALGSDAVSGGWLRWSDWLLLALVPAALTGLAAVTARVAVTRSLRQAL